MRISDCSQPSLTIISSLQKTDMEAFVKELSEELSQRMKRARVKGRTVGLKLMLRRQDQPQETRKFLGESSFCLFLGLCPILRLHNSCAEATVFAVKNVKVIFQPAFQRPLTHPDAEPFHNFGFAKVPDRLKEFLSDDIKDCTTESAFHFRYAPSFHRA